MKQEFFLKCDCDEEGLQFTRYHGDNELWISHWKRSHKTESLKNRLKLAWRIITCQEVNLWDIVINEDKQKDLKKFLERII